VNGFIILFLSTIPLCSIKLERRGYITRTPSETDRRVMDMVIVGIAPKIVAGGSQSLAIKSDESVVAWGNNFAGQRNVPADLRLNP